MIRGKKTRAPLGVLAALLILFLAPAALPALSTDLESADITVVLGTEGKAEVFYRLYWKASGGKMHGFYFQGEAFEPVWNLERCFADLGDGSRVPLEIKALGSGRYDVVLERGKGFTGEAYYFLNYAGDFGSAGLVGLTRSEESGELIYFDWAPVQWDEPLKARTVRLVLPIAVGGESLSEAERGAVPRRT
ncbi:MAG: hypothetical protein AB1407_13070, partial [Spirochaetota bacterium]